MYVRVCGSLAKWSGYWPHNQEVVDLIPSLATLATFPVDTRPLGPHFTAG